MTAALETPPLALLAHAIPSGATLFDRYQVRAKLAEGTVASVYRAHDSISGAEVALKVFDPLRSADPVARMRFEREFQVLSKIQHPGVARSLRLVTADELDVLVLEYVEGESLEARLSRGPYKILDAFELVCQIAEALEVCHGAGVVHRDLKPSNIILHPERGPVILDFGVAWVSSAMTLTRTGALVGSPRYMAPEMFESSDSDERADIYSLGAILFEALTGRQARAAESVAELAAEEEVEPPSVSAHRSDFPFHLDQLVTRAMARRPEERFATAREFAEAVRLRRSDLGRRLQTNLPCPDCRTPLLIDLPICPGCGKATDWALERGPCAVQLLEVPGPLEVESWLCERYADALTAKGRMLVERLRRAPVTLVLGASSATAEALAGQARERGCKTLTVRARRVAGPALRIPEASSGEVFVASFLHFAVVLVVGLGFTVFNALEWLDRLLPIAAAAAGTVVVLRYVRRPLISIKRKRAERPPHPMLAHLRVELARLEGSRGRRMAAMAVARAAPVLLGEAGGLADEAKEEVLAALGEAIEAARQLDVHHRVLGRRSRAALRAEIAEAMKQEDGDRLEGLRMEESELADVSVAHDFAARRVLEACQRITDAFAGGAVRAAIEAG